MSTPEWRKALAPFAQDMWALENRISEHLAGLDEDGLRLMERYALMPTETNCWYAVHRVAPIVFELVREERYRRERAASGSTREDER